MDNTFPPPEMTPRRSQRRFLRSSTNRVFSGVCAGVADYWGGDPTMVRLATVILGLFTGIFPMVILYVVVAIVVPERGVGGGVDEVAYGASAPAQAGASRPGSGALIVGLILIVVGVAGFAHEVLRIDTDMLWPVGLIGIGAAFILLTFRR